jgi:hypothetical protein
MVAETGILNGRGAHDRLRALPGTAAYLLANWTEVPSWLAIVEGFLQLADAEGLRGGEAVGVVNCRLRLHPGPGSAEGRSELVAPPSAGALGCRSGAVPLDPGQPGRVRRRPAGEGVRIRSRGALGGHGGAEAAFDSDVTGRGTSRRSGHAVEPITFGSGVPSSPRADPPRRDRGRL